MPRPAQVTPNRTSCGARGEANHQLNAPWWETCRRPMPEEAYAAAVALAESLRTPDLYSKLSSFRAFGQRCQFLLRVNHGTRVAPAGDLSCWPRRQSSPPQGVIEGLISKPQPGRLLACRTVVCLTLCCVASELSYCSFACVFPRVSHLSLYTDSNFTAPPWRIRTSLPSRRPKRSRWKLRPLLAAAPCATPCTQTTPNARPASPP